MARLHGVGRRRARGRRPGGQTPGLKPHPPAKAAPAAVPGTAATGLAFSAAPGQGTAPAELETLLPTNPFATVRYVESRRATGDEPWVVGMSDEGGVLQAGCAAFLKRGRVTRSLDVPSLPAVGARSPFWEGLLGFCRHHGISSLDLGTFGSAAGVEIPVLGYRFVPRSRREYVLRLDGDLSAALASNHKRNVKRAQQAGLVVSRSRSAEAAAAHHALMSLSLDRRRSRGEEVAPADPAAENAALLAAEAGELFQALHDGSVVSSVLVLRAPRGGYYHSAGTSPDGMAVGASHFLIHSIAAALMVEGAELFNLGGAEEGTGLARFKEGFGASAVPLPAATCEVGSSWRHGVARGVAMLRAGPAALLRLLRKDT
jgi:hypothetical protein